MTAVFLAVAVAFAWAGCIGFARFRSAYDRLHCVTFVAITAGAFVLAATVAADGFTNRSLKVFLFFLLTLANGAAIAHATGRAVMRRGPDAVE